MNTTIIHVLHRFRLGPLSVAYPAQTIGGDGLYCNATKDAVDQCNKTLVCPQSGWSEHAELTATLRRA